MRRRIARSFFSRATRSDAGVDVAEDTPKDTVKPMLALELLGHRLRRTDEMEATVTRGAVRFPRRVAELLRAGLDLRDRHAAGEICRHGLGVANERLAQHRRNHRNELFTFPRQPGLDATNWRGELAIRFGVILRKVWGGNRTWVGARAESVLLSVWRTCWQQGRSPLDFLSQLLRGAPVALALPP